MDLSCKRLCVPQKRALTLSACVSCRSQRREGGIYRRVADELACGGMARAWLAGCSVVDDTGELCMPACGSGSGVGAALAAHVTPLSVILGSGSFGSVDLVRVDHHHHDEQAAVPGAGATAAGTPPRRHQPLLAARKTSFPVGGGAGQQPASELDNELALLHACRGCPFVVRLYGTYRSVDAATGRAHVHGLLQWGTAGDLGRLLLQRKEQAQAQRSQALVQQRRGGGGGGHPHNQDKRGAAAARPGLRRCANSLPVGLDTLATMMTSVTSAPGPLSDAAAGLDEDEVEATPGATVHLQQQRQPLLPERQARYVLASVLLALRHLHRGGSEGDVGPVVHRDVKPSNILLSHVGPPLLADLGLAAALGTVDGASVCGVVGTDGYRAPEVEAQAHDRHAPGYGCPADIYSAGATLCAMLLGHPPPSAAVPGRPPHASSSHVSQPALPPDDEVVLSAEVRDLLAALLQPRPEARPTAAEALGHAWFQDDDDGAFVLYELQVRV